LLLLGEDALQRTTSSSTRPTDTQQPSVDSNVGPDQLWPPVDAKITTCQVHNTVQLQLSLRLISNGYIIGSLG